MHCKEMLGNGKTDSLADIAALSDGISSHRHIQICRKMRGLGCVNRRAQVTQPNLIATVLKLNNRTNA